MSGDTSTTTTHRGDAPGGAELAAELFAVDTTLLHDHDLLEHVAAAERLLASVHALQLRALADFARRPARVERTADDLAAASAQWARPGRWIREYANDEVAARLRISAQDASGRLALGCALETLPRTEAALSAGRIDVRRARVMADETRDLDRGVAAEIDEACIDLAERLPAARLRTKVRLAVVRADPIAAQKRSERAVGDRKVVIVPATDGMADLWAHLPAVEAMAIKTAITAAARASKVDREPGDDRTIDQRMADALAAPFAEALRTGVAAGAAPGSDGSRGSGGSDGSARSNGPGGPDGSNGLVGPGGSNGSGTGQRLARHRGQSAELHVTVAASTLLGLDDAPAMLRGYGPVTADVARALAPDSRMRRILTDPRSGAVLDVGTTVYKPPPDVQRFVEVRDQSCTFPGCGWGATSGELDHVVPFPKGSTSAANLHPPCPRHHHVKHHPAVSVERTDDGAIRWTMPTGHVYDVEPPAVGSVESDEGDLPPPAPPPVD